MSVLTLAVGYFPKCIFSQMIISQHTGKKGSFAYEKRRIIDEFTRTIAVELLQNQTIDFTSYLHGCMKYLSLQPEEEHTKYDLEKKKYLVNFKAKHA